MDADSSKRPNVLLRDGEPVSTTRLATIDVDADSDDDAPTQRVIDADPDDAARPTLQSPLPAFFPRGQEGPASLYPIELAAASLHKTPRNVRELIQRTAKRARIDLRVDSIVDLGGGVVAHKIGGKWFLRLPRR
jgi:hypothetical protein